MIALEQDPELIAWVCNELQIDNVGKCVIISLVFDSQLAAAAILNNYTTYNIELSVFVVEPRKIVRGFIRAVFRYCFNQLKVDRVTATVNTDNQHSYKSCLRLGFKREGVVRRARKGKDAYILGMLKEECRFL